METAEGYGKQFIAYIALAVEQVNGLQMLVCVAKPSDNVAYVNKGHNWHIGL